MEEKKTDGLGIASLVLGIVSIVFSFIGLSTIGLIVGIVGIILGVMGKKKSCMRWSYWNSWIIIIINFNKDNLLKFNKGKQFNCLPNFFITYFD